MANEFPRTVQDNGILLTLLSLEADPVGTVIGYRLDEAPFEFQAARAVLRGPDEREMPLLSVGPGLMRFAPLPAEWETFTCIVRTLSESDRLLPTTSRTAFDPYDPVEDTALLDKVEAWLSGDADKELWGTDCNGWWQFPLERPTGQPGAVQEINEAFSVAGFEFHLVSLARGASGARLSLDVYHPDEPMGELLHWMRLSQSWEEYAARCARGGQVPFISKPRPGLMLKEVTTQNLLRGQVTGPYTPLLGRYYVGFDPTQAPLVVLLDGITGLPLPEPWVKQFTIARFSQPVQVPIEVDLGICVVKGTLSIDLGERNDNLMLVCPEVHLEEGPVDQMWISGATLQDAKGESYEASGTSTVWLEGLDAFRTGFAYPPVHEAGNRVTFIVHTVDLALRQPLEGPVLPGY